MAETLVDHVERSLREAIIGFELPPASPLRVLNLVDRYRTGATPIREALSRLSREGLVEFTANKGFRVPELSRDDLWDLVAARTAVEVEALRLSMQHGDAAWEGGLIAALHRYRRRFDADNDVDAAIDLPAHDDIHVAMTAASGSPRLHEMQTRLLAQYKRYQRLVRVRHFRDGLVRQHADLVEVILARDIETAGLMLRQHLRVIFDVLDMQDAWSNLGVLARPFVDVPVARS